MTNATQVDNLAAMMLNPADHFSRPMDVARSDTLSKEEKLSVLKAMEIDARELSVAAEENMGGGEQASLAEVHEALRAVDPEAAARAVPEANSKLT